MHRYEQFYLTRCPAKQSVLGEEGITIRASSLSAEEIQSKETGHALVQITGYDLPQFQREKRGNDIIDAIRSPVRLARIKTDQGLVLVHSVSRVDIDTRPGNYFSHAILMESHPMNPRQCLGTWGNHCDFAQNGGWVREDSNEKQHEQVSDLPHWSPENTRPTFSIEKSTTFENSIASQFLTPAIGRKTKAGDSFTQLPRRLEENNTQRSEILKHILALFLSGQRVLSVGESELAAVLFSAITEMVPDTLVADFTFSTYESRKQLAINTFDFSNTVLGELTHETQSRASFLANVSVVDTHSELTSDSFDVHPDADSYANYTVNVFQERSENNLKELKRLWTFFERFTKRKESPTNDLFVEAWQKWYRVNADTTSLTLSEREIRKYLNNPDTRPLLLEVESGTAKTAEHVVRNAVRWWPEMVASLDENKKKELFHLISKELLIFAQQNNWEQHCVNRCLNHLLPQLRSNPITDFMQYTSEQLDSIVTQLPFKRRTFFFECIEKSSENVSPASCWLTFMDDIDLLRFLKRDCYAEQWKVDAALHSLETRSASKQLDRELADFLHTRTSLLYKIIIKSSQESDEASRIHRLLITSYESKEDRISFCQNLLFNIPFEKDQRFCRPLLQCFNQLERANGNWLLFFNEHNKDRFRSLLRMGVKKDIQGTGDLLKTLVTSIQPSVINRESSQHDMFAMLHKLAIDLKKTRSNATDTETSFIANVKHWKVLLTSAYISKTKVDWPTLQQSIKYLNYKDSYLFARLIDKLPPTESSRTNRDYKNIVRCAQVACGKDDKRKIKQLFQAALEQVKKPANEKQQIREVLESTLYSIVGLD